MGRNRVLSFMSQFSNRDARASNSNSPTFQNNPAPTDASRRETYGQELPQTPPSNQQQFGADSRRSPGRPLEWGEGEQSSSRPVSMVQTYQPPLMEMNQDTLPELQPIFTFLNSHGNKLYQEGYFLKLDDQNSQGKPNADRTWTECFAQLVGTVLSLWDAAELDAAGQDGEVLPKFINLTDASIRMIEALPTRSNDDQPLQNVLSVSTAGKNRYLLHFNSHHSLIQWTAGIRLAMYEHTTLQEAYTGALIAGKGKSLNNINIIMARSRLPTEDWVRVRFGAGTPWRRCWCVITPPDEKEFQRLQKEISKKKSAYDNSRPPVLKGDVKFYDTKKTKKTQPIASLSDAYSAFAIYPQSKPLIDASTLIKVEGTIMIHSNPPTSTEGFVFVMPEVHPAVSGFEMMLRWLFPVFDTFALYGRPGRLIADTLDPRSLMFAMPKERRYGYLEILDVTGLILTTGSQNWREMEWRRKMKELTGRRMTAIANGSRSSRYSSRRNTRNSYGGGPLRSRTDLNDSGSVRSQNSVSWGPAPPGDGPFDGLPRTDSAPPASAMFQPGRRSMQPTHHRSVSESHGLDRYTDTDPSKFDGGSESGPPPPPPHRDNYNMRNELSTLRYERETANTPERLSFEDDVAGQSTPVRELRDQQAPTSLQPVAVPPAFAHAPGTLPASKPFPPPEMRIAKNRMSQSTLSHMTTGSVDMAPPLFNPGGQGPRLSNEQRRESQGRQPEDTGVFSDANTREVIANHSLPDGGITATGVNRTSFERSLPQPPGSSGSDRSAFASSSRHPHSRTSQSSMAGPQNHLATSDDQYSHKHTSSTESAHSINRKPLPMRTSSDIARDSVSPAVDSSAASLDAQVIDQEGFDRIVPRHQGNNANPQPKSEMHGQRTDNSSVSDAASFQTPPEYASTQHSKDARGSSERQRQGIMRTVGSDPHPTPTNATEPSSDIPVVNFGPTINYGADRLPGEPAIAPQTPPKPRNVRTPEPDQYRRGQNGSPNRMGQNGSPNRMVAWQPGMAAVGPNQPGRQLTPEQFVQLRAAAAVPHYGHGRQQSQNSVQMSNATSPLTRSQSTEFLSHSRGNSSDLLQRPSSQGQSGAYGPSGSGDYSTNLSAREQEHLARVTGSPLVNRQVMNSRGAAPTAGLIGAIETRVQEQRAIKQGINGQAVQDPINQRQPAPFQQSLSQPPAKSASQRVEHPIGMGPALGIGPPKGMGPAQGIGPPNGMEPPRSTGPSQVTGSSQSMGPPQGVVPHQERQPRRNTNSLPPQPQFPPQLRQLPWGPPRLASKQGGNWMPPQPRLSSPQRQQQQQGGRGRGQQNYRGPESYKGPA